MLKELFKKWFDKYLCCDIPKTVEKPKEIIPQVEEVIITERLVKEEPKPIEVIPEKRKYNKKKKVEKKQTKKPKKKKK